MFIRSILPLVVTPFLFVFNGLATVTSLTYTDDGDGAIVCPPYEWTGGDTVNIYGDQYSGPGHVNFTVGTDTEQDPTLLLINAIDNDTAFAWTGYEVDIMMNKTFTLSGANVLSPGDWTIASLVQPGSPVAGIYTGHMIFSGGTPIAPLGTLDFSFNISFLGSVQFTEQLTPVPEPAALSFLVGGALLLGWTRFQRRQG